jgi:hypothetical protein
MYRKARMIGRVRENLNIFDVEHQRHEEGALLYPPAS